MRVERWDNDFYVYLTKEDVLKVRRRISFQENPLLAGQYHTICVEIENSCRNPLETLSLTCTRDASILSSGYTRDNIYFRRVDVYRCPQCGEVFLSDEWGCICPYDDIEMKVIERGVDVRIFPPLLSELLNGKLDHIGTRYNGQDKILVFLH